MERGTGTRIPSTLQTVFLASNRGKEVNRPPPGQVAHRMFARMFGRKGELLNFAPVKEKRSKKSARKKKKEAEAAAAGVSQITPQKYLDVLLRSRGYSDARYKTLEGGYYSKPTALQIASYSVYLNDVIRHKTADEVKEIVGSGLSPNACNQFGESLVHNVCRRGEYEKLKVLVDLGCQIQVADDYGRTPMHDACWSPNPCFEVIELLLEKDVRLFQMTDARDSTPLKYIHRDLWAKWINFLEVNKDRYWPFRDVVELGDEQAPALHCLKPNSCPVPDPLNALPEDLAALVASGRLSPKEAILLSSKNKYAASDTEDDDSFSDSDEEDSESEYSESDSDIDEEELLELAARTGHYFS